MTREIGLCLILGGMAAFAYEGLHHYDLENAVKGVVFELPRERQGPLWGMLALAGGCLLASKKKGCEPSFERVVYYRLYTASRKQTER